MPRITIWAFESKKDYDRYAVKCLARKLAAYHGLDVQVDAVGHQAFNDVRKKLRKDSEALEKAVRIYLKDSNCVIFVTDSDSYHRLAKRRNDVNSAISQIERVKEKFKGQVHLVLAVHELEAWLLVDCLGICCYFAGVENSSKSRQRQQGKFQSLLKQAQRGNTEFIVEAEPGGAGPKEALIAFSEKILKRLDSNIKSKSLNRKKYRESLSPDVAEYIEINDETLRRNNSFRRFGQYLKKCGTG